MSHTTHTLTPSDVSISNEKGFYYFFFIQKLIQEKAII